MKRKPSKQATGGNRMVELGYRPVQIWLDEHEYAQIKAAAKKDRRPMTKYMLIAALTKATQDTWLKE
jgi:uncharacterized protein (DUF1778 family)